MNKKSRLKITPVLITLNIVLLLFIISFYTIRLVKYYVKENGTKKSNGNIVLVNEILKHQSYVDLTKGLVYDDKNNNYKYKGKVDDNYVLYSGMLFRIVGIDNENNIKLISEDNVTMLYGGLEKGYSSSYVNKWLNKIDKNANSGIFEKALYNSNSILEYTYLCSDKIDDLSNITCQDYYMDSKATLLSLYDYKEAGGKSSYLNNGNEFALATLNSKNEDYFVTSTGEIGLNQRARVINVRPVITIKESTLLISGKGTKDDPYIIEKHEVKTLKDVYINSIIKFDDKLYKVVDKNENSIKVAGTSVLKDKEENLKIAFSTSSSEYSVNNTVGKYLNNTFYNSLKNKDLLVSGPWYVGLLTLDKLDYTSYYNKKIDAKIGMLTLGDFYVGDLNNIFTLSRGIEGTNIINVINKDGNVFADKTSSKYNVRASFYLDNSILIDSGNGTNESPYLLGVKDEKK